MEQIQLNVEVAREDDMYIALCPELDIASQGQTIEEATDNLTEAITGWLETASKSEIERRLPYLHRPQSKIFTTRIEVPYGQTAETIGA